MDDSVVSSSLDHDGRQSYKVGRTARSFVFDESELSSEIERLQCGVILDVPYIHNHVSSNNTASSPDVSGMSRSPA